MNDNCPKDFKEVLAPIFGYNPDDAYTYKNRRDENLRRKTVNFLEDDTCCGVKCDEKIVKAFLKDDHFDSTINDGNTLWNVYNDYEMKSCGVYNGLISSTKKDVECDDLIVQKKSFRSKWVKDFVSLSEKVIQGKYEIDDVEYELSSLPYSIPNSSEDDDMAEMMISKIKSIAGSRASCYLYFVNYLYIMVEDDMFVEKEEAIRKLFRIILFGIENYYSMENFFSFGVELEENFFDIGSEEIVRRIYNKIGDKFESCKTKNINEYKLPFLPDDTDDDLGATWFFSDVNNVFADESDEDNQIKMELIQLGLSQGLLFFIWDIKSMRYEKRVFPTLEDIKQLLFDIQDYLYDTEVNNSYKKTKEEYERFKKEYENLSEEKVKESHSDLNDIRHEQREDNYLYFLDQINNIINSEWNSGNLHILMEKKLRLSMEVSIRCGNMEEAITIMDKIVDGISKKIEEVCSLDSGFIDCMDKISTEFGPFETVIKNKIGTYLSSVSPGLNIEEEFQSIKKSLSTGEYLYGKFVSNPSFAKMDYSCVAIEYYTALEHLLNLLLYKPYKLKVLDSRTNISNIIGDAHINTIKDKFSLELGPITYLYKEGSSFGNTPKLVELFNYVRTEMHWDETKIDGFMHSINEIRDLRNDSAHGSKVLDVKKAKKAQDVTYKHEPVPDIDCNIAIADGCHNLITELLQWAGQDTV